MKPKIASLTICLSLVFAATDLPPVLAQASNPIWMLGMGSSLIYPLSRTIGMPYLGGPYNANPLYSTFSYLRPSNSWPNVYPFTNASYGPWGYRNAGMMPGYFNATSNDPNNPNNPKSPNFQGSPRAQDEPDSSNPAANTMNSTNPYQPPPPPAPYTAPPAPVPSSGGAPGAFSLPGSGASASAPSKPSAYALSGGNAGIAPSLPSAPSAGALPGHFPPPGATSHAQAAPPAVPVSGSTVVPPAVSAVGAAAPAALSSGAPALGRPLAEGFINHLNANYQGDMSKALSNPDTRSWARAMGVIGDDVQDGSHLSSDRLEVLGRLMKDNSLDPVSKLDTMRILLKKSTPAAAN